MYCISCEVRTEFIYVMQKKIDHLCGLVVRVPKTTDSEVPGSIPGATRFFWEVAGQKRGPLSLVSTIEELLGRKNCDFDLECREYGRRNPSRCPRGTPYQQELVLTSSTSGGCSVGIVRSRTHATDFSFMRSFCCVCVCMCFSHIDFWTPEPSCMKIRMYTKPPNPSLQLSPVGNTNTETSHISETKL
jgi:hypothetical protein